MLSTHHCIIPRLAKSSTCTKRQLSFFWKMLAMDDSKNKVIERPLYTWDESPYEDIRERAAMIRAQALCPVTSKPVNFVCPYSGIPTHHSKEAWEQDKQYHESKVYEKLKKVNLYEHDLRSGRKFAEFAFPKKQERDFMVNISDWDSFFYTRDFPPMNDEFNLAAATKVLTYPITIASILHKFSPLQLEPKGPLTLEGAKSLGALRYTLYPPQLGKSSTNAASTNSDDNAAEIAFKERPMRIFLIGPRMEGMLPGYIWKQFGYLFPNTEFEIHLIGPEAYYDKKLQKFTPVSDSNGRPLVQRFDEQITLHYHSKFFNELYDMGDLFPFDPYLDIFFCFHPNFQSADQIHWDKSLKGLLESKCPVFISGYHEQELTKDIEWLKNHELYPEMDIILNDTPNKFACTKYDIRVTDPTNPLNLNSRLFGFRGKRYHAIQT